MIIILINCAYCGQDFDINSTDFIRFSNSNYLHRECIENYLNNLSEDDKNKYSLELYINNLFKIKSIPQSMIKTINEFIINYGFSYTGILKTLIYWYDIQKKSVKDSHGSIGIVPYIYSEAKAYYKKLNDIELINKDKDFEEYAKIEKEYIHITPPISETKKRKAFKFLDEE